MWSDNTHNQGFTHSRAFQHGSALEKLCLHSRLGCVLAGGLRRSTGSRGESQLAPSFLAQLQDPPTPPPTTQVTAEAAVFVAVIVVFYAAIIVILLGTNMRHPPSSSASSSRPGRSRSRSRSRYRHRHELVLNPSSGAVSTQHTRKKRRNSMSYSGEIPETV